MSTPAINTWGQVYNAASDLENVLNGAWRNILQQILSMPAGSIRPANQNGPTGMLTDAAVTIANQFATVLISSIQRIGQGNHFYTPNPADTTGETQLENVQELKSAVATIQFFRGDAMNKARQIETLMKFESTIALMQQNGLGFIRTGQVQNVAAIIDTLDEQRSSVDVEFNFTVAMTQVIGTYIQFPLTITDNNATVSEVITAP